VGIRRTKHAVYDLKYHLVGYLSTGRKEVSDYLKAVFSKITEEYNFNIDTMEVMEDHVHICLVVVL
jgi:putative transposase